MVRITEELVRKRAEHNESEIFSLEELSLHQQNIEKIEHLDKWCKDLKILYFQSNLIPKIENVGRLKKLEYLNLALNNIERIENLEGCEFLNKLDLTVNFIGELTSVENLIENYHLKELYLTGNPCTEFEGYRDYVISTLPQLKFLDGTEIKKSDRIKALQNYRSICDKILEKQNEYFRLREKQKKDFERIKKEREGEDIDEDKYWSEKSDFTPESRIQAHIEQERIQKKHEEEKNKTGMDYLKETHKRERKYFDDSGKPFNFNELMVDFIPIEDDGEKLILTVKAYKYMDSSLINVDVQPNYVRVTLKGKSLQLALEEEVKPDSSSALRSQTTGHLVITMPKVNAIIRPKIDEKANKKANDKKEDAKKANSNFLEVDESKIKNRIDFANIVNDNKNKVNNFEKYKKVVYKERENSPDFVDNSDVPPLE